MKNLSLSDEESTIIEVKEYILLLICIKLHIHEIYSTAKLYFSDAYCLKLFLNFRDKNSF